MTGGKFKRWLMNSITGPGRHSGGRNRRNCLPTNYSQVHDTVLRRQVESAQYTSVAFTQRLLNEGVDPSVGSVGDALDNALAETTVGSFKNELIRRQGPWRDVNQVELATAE